MKRLTPLLPVYILMLFVIFMLPFFSAAGYSIIKHTTSELGAQNAPNAWVMNVVFALLGLGSILTGIPRLKGYYFHQAVVIVFGASLILAGIYSHAPISPDIVFSQREDSLHSLFASTTGLSFTLFAVAYIFITTEPRQKILALVMAVFATAISLLMFALPDYTGLLQRGMFIVTFGWLLYIFTKSSYLKDQASSHPV
jgi:hypothetical membrane protein